MDKTYALYAGPARPMLMHRPLDPEDRVGSLETEARRRGCLTWSCCVAIG